MTDDRRPPTDPQADPYGEPVQSTSLHTPPDFDAPAFPELKQDSRDFHDPERGQHLIWVFLALIIALVAWWGI